MEDMNRIQKLLFSDYSDFEDIVLLESPFAETDRHGDGIRQVHMGLTPTKVIIATDVVQPAQDVDIMYCFGLDPEIENFELISLYPTEHVNLSIFRRKERQTIKAHFSNGVIKYFELGGFNRRQMFWNLWCERLLYLHPFEVGSSCSETSVASTMSGSTLYLKWQKIVITDTGKTQFWHQYDASPNSNEEIFPNYRWSERNVSSGKKELEILPRHRSIQYGSSITELRSFYGENFKLTPRSQHSWPSTCSQLPPLSNVRSEKSVKKVNRFGNGVPENCQINLFLSHEQDQSDIYWDCKSVSFLNTTEKNSNLCVKELYNRTSVLPEKQSLVDSILLQWEDTGVGKMRHLRRYGFVPEPHLLNGVGLINVAVGDLYSIQIKRAVSAVCLSVPPMEEMIQIQTQRTFLSVSTSHETLSTAAIVSCPVQKHKPCRFWVAKKYYHLKPFTKRYQNLQKMLKKIYEFHCRQTTGNVTHRKRSPPCKSKYSITKRKADDMLKLQKLQLVERAKNNSSMSFIHRVTTRGKRKGKVENIEIKENESLGDSNNSYGKSFLTLHDSSYRIRAIHIGGSALAYQLTMIDRELFLNITAKEIHTLFKQHSTLNTPNIGAIIAFSHRISCLVATEVLAENYEKERAHIIIHFINIISNCNKHNNFQACHNILAGLQNPSIFRLHSSWAYIRRKHASKYRTFERFCRQYRDPRMKLYQQVFHRASLSPPYLPSINHIIALVLGRIPKRTEAQLTQFPLQQGIASFEEDNLPPCIPSQVKHNFDKNEKEPVQGQSKVHRFLSAFRIWATPGQQVSSSSENSSNMEQFDACSINNNNNEHSESSGDHKRLPLCECEHKVLVDLNNFFEPLTDANSPDKDNIEMLIVQILKHQKAVERYNLCEDEIAKDFLLREKYQEEIDNFKRSLEIEP